MRCLFALLLAVGCSTVGDTGPDPVELDSSLAAVEGFHLGEGLPVVVWCSWSTGDEVCTSVPWTVKEGRLFPLLGQWDGGVVRVAWIQ